MGKGKIHVFVSYAHANTSVMETLKHALEETRLYDIKNDTGADKLAQDAHREISNAVNWSDIVIPIITTDWLASQECRDELVRAHERRKRTIPFRHKTVTNDGPPKVPHFLQEVVYTTWEERILKIATRW